MFIHSKGLVPSDLSVGYGGGICSILDLVMGDVRERQAASGPSEGS